MRTAFIQQLIIEARRDPSIFLIVGDLGYSVVEPFAEEFPDRFLNAGVAEQNMAGMAAGLAMEGYMVFIYSIANFPTLRCMEQIRNDICYHKLDVKIVSVGAGFAYGPLGMSHHATEDLGMMRMLPEMEVVSPCDPVETRLVTRMLAGRRGPGYLRLGKAGERRVYSSEPEFSWGEFAVIKPGIEVAIVGHGSVLGLVLDRMRESRSGWALCSAPFINRMKEQQVIDLFGRYEKIITVEENQVAGGFGSVLLEYASRLLMEKKIDRMPEIQIHGIPGTFVSTSGSQDFLREKFGLGLTF